MVFISNFNYLDSGTLIYLRVPFLPHIHRIQKTQPILKNIKLYALIALSHHI